jgi:23S rRNA pseudouridine2605 synthase
MSDDDSPSGVRLQKVLAVAGFGSRRECEELITEGRVEIDGKVADELGVRVDPQRQKIHVDGVLVKTPKMRYYVLNKPKGVLSTNRDPDGRPRAIDLVPEEDRVFTVGRLDKESEGLLLLTNDGELANRLAHPRYGVPKTYMVAVQGAPDEETLRQLKEGVPLAEGIARVAQYKIRRKTPNFTELELTLQEGKNREVRRIFAKLGHKVLRLRRISLGPLRLGELPVGAHRLLTHEELDKLREAAGTGTRKRPSRPGAKNSRQVLEEGKRKAQRRAAEDAGDAERPRRPGGFAKKAAPGGPRPATGRGAYAKKQGAPTSRGPAGRGAPGKKRAFRSPEGEGAAYRPGGAGGRPNFSKPTGPRGKFAGRRPVGEGRPASRPGRPGGFEGGEGEAPRPRKKFADGPRPSGNRPTGARPAGTRPPGKRPAPPRPGGARPAGARPGAGRPAGAPPVGKRAVKKAPPRPDGPKKRAGGPPIPLSKRLKRNAEDD